MQALKSRAGMKLALVVAALGGALLMAAVIGFKGEARTSTATASSAKGSSCASPYRVIWNVPSNHAKVAPVGPGLFYGDTKYIQVRTQVKVTASLNYFVVSWKPLIGGLKFCEARITYEYGKPFVSHQWHRVPVKIAENPARQDRITSFVVTAAR